MEQMMAHYETYVSPFDGRRSLLMNFFGRYQFVKFLDSYEEIYRGN